MRLDTKLIRSYFPALDGDWTYFDNAGGSQTLRPVVDRLADYLLHTNVQHGASYGVSVEAVKRVRDAHLAMAALVNAKGPEEVVMGSSTSLLLRILASRLRQHMRPGDEVIVTDCDHEANIGPWRELAESGIVVREWKTRREDFRLHADDLRDLLGDRTRLVAMTHVSNILGTINPISDIARMVHNAGAKLCVDGVAYAPHRLIDVRAWDVDYYAFSFYKTYGPHYAMLYGRHEDLRALPAWNHFFIGEDDVPYKFQPGNVNYELAYSMLGLADYLREVGSRMGAQTTELRDSAALVFDAVAEHESELAEKLLAFLRNDPRVRIIGDPDSNGSVRVPTVSFVAERDRSDDIVSRVDRHRIAIRYGDFYARRLIDGLGLSDIGGVVRVSMVHYNTAQEVDRLLTVLDRVL